MSRDLRRGFGRLENWKSNFKNSSSKSDIFDLQYFQQIVFITTTHTRIPSSNGNLEIITNRLYSKKILFQFYRKGRFWSWTCGWTIGCSSFGSPSKRKGWLYLFHKVDSIPKVLFSSCKPWFKMIFRTKVSWRLSQGKSYLQNLYIKHNHVHF